MALNKGLYKFLGLSAFLVSAMFILFAVFLYRTGGNYLAALCVAVFEVIAGFYLLKKSGS